MQSVHMFLIFRLLPLQCNKSPSLATVPRNDEKLNMYILHVISLLLGSSRVGVGQHHCDLQNYRFFVRMSKSWGEKNRSVTLIIQFTRTNRNRLFTLQVDLL